MILDVGPKSIAALSRELADCETLVWNGPLGAFEIETVRWRTGPSRWPEAVARLTSAGKLLSVAGGGDTGGGSCRRAGGQSPTSRPAGRRLPGMDGSKTLPGVAALVRAAVRPEAILTRRRPRPLCARFVAAAWVRRSFRESAFPTATTRAAGLRALRVHPLSKIPRSSPARCDVGRADPARQAGDRTAQGFGPCRPATWSSARRPSRRPSASPRRGRATSRSNGCSPCTGGPHRPGAEHVSRAADERRRGGRRGERGSGAGRVGRHPWEQLAFPTVVWALAISRVARKSDFPTYSNPRAISPAWGRASQRESERPEAAASKTCVF